jgi:hypothetical protein
LLDKYRVSTLVIDKAERRGLQAAARKLADWKIVYEDEQAIILVRGGQSAVAAG